MKLQKIFDEYKFSDAEREFMHEAGTDYTKDINQSRVVSEFILGKRIEEAAESTREYSRKIAWFTGALVFVGLVQIVVGIITN